MLQNLVILWKGSKTCLLSGWPPQEVPQTIGKNLQNFINSYFYYMDKPYNSPNQISRLKN